MKWLVGVGVIGLAGAVAMAEFDLETVARQTQLAIVRLDVYDRAGNEIATGNGFFVSADGKLVTDFRLVERAARVLATPTSGEPFPVEGMLGTDVKNDLALLKLTTSNQTCLVLGNTGTLVTGQRVAIVSSPLRTVQSGTAGTVLSKPLLIIGADAPVPVEGTVLSVRTLFGETRRIQVAATIDPRAAGSPVVDEHGAVIGVIRALVSDPRLLNYAIPADAVRKLLANASAKPVSLLPRHKVGDNADSEVFLSPEWQRAVAAQESGDWAAVLAAAQALVSRFPGYAEAHASVGSAYMELKSYDNAVAAYRHALQLDPDYAYAWVGLGVNYLAQGKDAAAIAAYRQAIKLMPKSALPWGKLGEVYCQQEKYGDAIAAYRQMTQLDPRNPAAWANLGISCEGQGKWTEAIAAYRRAVELEPDYPFAWVRLGVTCGQSGRPDEARLAYRQATQYKPDFPAAWLSLGVNPIVRANRAATVGNGGLLYSREH